MGGEVRWGELTHPRALGVLSNPCYAGAYVFGRYRYRRAVRPDGTITTSVTELPRAQWPVLIQDHHPGYITWERFLANERRLAANDTHSGQRPPREGRALCQGILRCGACGGSMTTLHRREGSYYECGHSRADHINTPACRSVKTTVVDELIARRLLEALAPEEIALALAAADEVSDRRARSTRAVELRVERARYEAIRAERAFHACEPENRLVARSLETRWEHKLQELNEATAELAEQTKPAPEPSREHLEALARDLPKLWTADSTQDRDRKRLLRTIIVDVTITSQPTGRELSVGIRWRSGASEQHAIQRPKTRAEVIRTPSEAIELTRSLAPDHTNLQIAEQLNAAGLHAGTRRPVQGRARAMDPLAPQDPLPDHVGPRRGADRHRDRRAARRLGRNRLRLDQHRQAHRPPRARQPALHPLRSRRRAAMPTAHHQLHSPTGRNQNQGCRRCSLMPPSPLSAIASFRRPRRR